jgi:hypothetical protein
MGLRSRFSLLLEGASSGISPGVVLLQDSPPQDSTPGIVMPDTRLNGYYQELFRKQQFLLSDWPVELKVNEI